MTQQTQTKMADWRSALNLPTRIAESFFQPDSTPQRVVVMNVEGFGDDGIGVVLETKDKKTGEVVETKKATCFAKVHVNNEDLTRSQVWDVLSRPAALAVGQAIDAAGVNWPGTLVVDIWTTGRGLQKQFHVQRVAPELIQAEKDAEAALAADKAEKAEAPEVLACEVLA